MAAVPKFRAPHVRQASKRVMAQLRAIREVAGGDLKTAVESGENDSIQTARCTCMLYDEAIERASVYADDMLDVAHGWEGK